MGGCVGSWVGQWVDLTPPIDPLNHPSIQLPMHPPMGGVLLFVETPPPTHLWVGVWVVRWGQVKSLTIE